MKSVFLTGATGTIGSALVPALLDEQDTVLSILVRAGNEAELASRTADMLRYWGLQPDSDRAARIRVILGDISQPRLGTHPAAYARLTSETTHIIHCAASVKLNMSLEEARSTAVSPTRAILELGRQCADASQLRKIDLVSTVGVWGRTPGLMPEKRLPQVEGFHNTYEAAKWEAERVIWREGMGLPVTVHRPSMVVGETGSGRVIHFQVFYHLCEFLSGSRTFGVMPDLGTTKLDIIPVNWVAQAIRWSSNSPDAVGKIFHLCSGPDGAVPLTTLQQTVRGAMRARGRRLPSLWRVNRRMLQGLIPLIGALAGKQTQRALRALPPILAYLADDQGFSNVGTRQVMSSIGLPVPDAATYLDTVLRYYLEARDGAAAA